MDPGDAHAGERDRDQDRHRQHEALEQEAHQQVDEGDRHERRDHQVAGLLGGDVAHQPRPGHAFGQVGPRGDGAHRLPRLALPALFELDRDPARGLLVAARDPGRGRLLAHVDERADGERLAAVGRHREVAEFGEALAVLFLETDANGNVLAAVVDPRQSLAAQRVADHHRQRPRVDLLAHREVPVQHQGQLVRRLVGRLLDRQHARHTRQPVLDAARHLFQDLGVLAEQGQRLERLVRRLLLGGHPGVEPDPGHLGHQVDHPLRDLARLETGVGIDPHDPLDLAPGALVEQDEILQPELFPHAVQPVLGTREVLDRLVEGDVPRQPDLDVEEGLVVLRHRDDLEPAARGELGQRQGRHQEQDHVEPPPQAVSQHAAVGAVQETEARLVRTAQDGVRGVPDVAQRPLLRRLPGRQRDVDRERDDHQRHRQGRQQRHRDRDDQPQQHELPLPVDQGHRQEDDHRRQRGGGDRQRDLSRALQGRPATPHAALVQAVDVLGHDHRVVHQQADRDHQPQERDHVEGLAEEVHRDHRDDHGERDREGDDERHPQPAEEEEEDDHREDRPDPAARQEHPHRVADDLARAHDHVDVERREPRVPGQFRDHPLHLARHLQRVRVALLLHLDRVGRQAVDPHPVLVVGHVVAHRGDVAQAHRVGDPHVADVLGRGVPRHRPQQQLPVAGADVAGRQREVVAGQVLGDLEDVQTRRLDPLPVELDQHLPLEHPLGVDGGHAGQALELEDDLVPDQVVDVRRLLLDDQADHGHRHPGVVVLADEDLLDVLGHPPAGALDPVPDLAVGDVHVRPVREAQEHLGEADAAVRVLVLQPADRRQFLLQRDRDLVQHLLGRGVAPRHGHPQEGRAVAGGDQLDRQGQGRHQAHDQHRADDDEHADAAFQRQPGQGDAERPEAAGRRPVSAARAPRIAHRPVPSGTAAAGTGAPPPAGASRPARLPENESASRSRSTIS